MSTKKNEIEQIGNGTYTRNMWLFPQTDESHSLNLIKDLDQLLHDKGLSVRLRDLNDNTIVDSTLTECLATVSKMATKIAITQVFNNQTKVRRFERDFDEKQTEVVHTDYIGTLRYSNGRVKGEFDIPRKIARTLSDKSMSTIEMTEMLSWIAKELYCRQTVEVRKEQTTEEDFHYKSLDYYKFKTMNLILEDRFCEPNSNDQHPNGSFWGSSAGRVDFDDNISVYVKMRLRTPISYGDYDEHEEFQGINHAVANKTFLDFSRYAMSIELTLTTDKVLTAEEVDLYLKESWTEMAIYYKQKFEEYMTLHSSIVRSFLAPIFGFESNHGFSKRFEIETHIIQDSRFQYCYNENLDTEWMILREDFEDLFPQKFESVLHCNTVYKSEMGQVCDLGIGRAKEL